PGPESGAAAAATNTGVAGANWSGRPRRLLAPVPLQIRTCGTTASGSSDHGFAFIGSPNPLSVKVALTQSRARSLAVFPLDGSVIRHSASLHWLPRRQF